MATASTSAAADFSCSICFEMATEPVVTRCGHLFCWSCLDAWLQQPDAAPECPVCKGRVDEHVTGDIIPLYGKGAHARRQQAPPSQRPGHGVDAAQRTNSSSSSSTTSTHTASPPHAEERRRPTAPRAPTPPRPRDNMFAMNGVRGRLQLPMFNFLFLWHGGIHMGLVFLSMIVWVLYCFTPWEHWLARAQHYVRSLRRSRTQGSSSNSSSSSNNNNNNNNNSSSTNSSGSNHGSRSSGGGDVGDAEGSAQWHDDLVVDAEALLRNVCLTFLTACFLYILLLA